MYDFRIGENSKFGVNTLISMAYVKRSHVSFLDLWQNNLNNPDTFRTRPNI